MRILTEVGEIGVHHGDREYKLRPSLYAMSQLGDPKEIVELYVNVMGNGAFDDALSVIFACSEEDLSPVFGCYVPAQAGTGWRYKAGKADIRHVMPIAQCLLKHGITGSLPEIRQKEQQSGSFTQEFNARDHVALAMAHLGMSELDAWDLTMTSLVGALRSKYPPQPSNDPGSKAPTKQQHDETMAWFERVEAMRTKRNGAH